MKIYFDLFCQHYLIVVFFQKMIIKYNEIEKWIAEQINV